MDKALSQRRRVHWNSGNAMVSAVQRMQRHQLCQPSSSNPTVAWVTVVSCHRLCVPKPQFVCKRAIRRARKPPGNHTRRRICAPRSCFDPACTPPATALAQPIIDVLPVSVVQRIAAGEILHGVHSVVRELVENSLDAHASIIRVDLDTRSATVTVADDGIGIPAAHLACTAACNATSKLRSVDDLEAGIATFGFRGQGLWAVSSASEAGLLVRSRASGADIGSELVFDALGHAVHNSSGLTPMAHGTVIRANGLRRWGAFDAKSRRQVRDWLTRTALVHRRVAIRLSVDGRLTWRRDAMTGMNDGADGADSSDGAAAALAAAMRRSAADFRAAEVAIAGDAGAVCVAAGLPDTVSTGTARWMVVAVNGRAVRLPAVTAAVRAAVALPRGRFPIVLVEISLPPALVDWNVSPIKSEVRLRGEGTVDAVLRAAVHAFRAALRWVPGEGAGYEDADASLVRLVRAAGDESVRVPLQGAAAGAGDATLQADNETHVGWTEFRVISQLLNTYILVEHASAITLIEQHVAHERVLYEGLLKAWSNSFTCLETVLPLPETVSEDQVFNLVSLGFEAAHVDTAWQVRTAPKSLLRLPRENLLTAVLALSNDAHTPATACAKLACDAAVRNGTPLPRSRMRDLVRDLGACDDARTCPHGRRTVLPLSERALAALFGRPLGAGGPLPRRGMLRN